MSSAATAKRKSSKAKIAKKATKKDKVVEIELSKKKQKTSLTQRERSELVLEFRMKARKLARSILRKWHARLDLQEVDSVVDLSLCEAVKRFNPTKGASFLTFLYYHLRGNLIRAVSTAASQNAVPGYDDDVTATASNAGINAIEVAEALCSHESLPPDEVLLKKELIELSSEACSRLDELEREVIERIYLKGQQLIDIAASLGYSRCHISRVKKKALETLQEDMTVSLNIEKITENSSEPAGLHEITLRRTSRRTVQRRRPRSKNKIANSDTCKSDLALAV